MKFPFSLSPWITSASLLVGLSTGSMAATKSRNVLLLCVDDLRPVMGCYGGAAKTPIFDQFSKEAATFTQHYVQWPVCGPSRASMLGGLRPDSTGIYEIGDSWKISKRPDTHPTMPQYFMDNGYHTQSFGKVYHSMGDGEGFGWSVEPWALSWDCYVNFQPDGDDKNTFHPAYEIFENPESVHNDYQTADKLISAIKTLAESGEPFFLAGGFYKPHLPFVAPQAYWDLYSDEEVDLLDPETLPQGAGDYMYGWTELAAYGNPGSGVNYEKDASPSADEARKMTHAYYACVSFIDAQIGRVLAALNEAGLADTTAVVVWGDHGFHLGDQGRWGKHTQFEGAMRSPLMVRLPGHQNVTGRTEAIVESVDIYATLCEFAGLKVPTFTEGESFLPVIEGKASGKEAAFSQIRPVGGPNDHRPMAYSVRTENFRYVEWRDDENLSQIVKRELYDLSEASAETVNLADNPEYKSIVERHSELVKSNFGSL